MVVFTCNHCGESLQKPKVEKHYLFSCKKPVFLTCVDCLKDFRGDEFDVHTKCFTEDERYGAKGQVNGVVKKGEVKQESWVEMIRSIIKEEPNMKPPHRNLLNKISAFNNVPRKKPKFLNFIKSSSSGRINMADVEAVWDIIEKYKGRHSNTLTSKIEENGNGQQIQGKLEDTKSVSAKKQKKRKKETVNEKDLSENGIAQEEPKPKKTSKRKSGDVSENIASDQSIKEINVPTQNGEKLEKKKKKKKKSSNQPEAENVNGEPSPDKKKSNSVDENEEAQQSDVVTSIETEKEDPQPIPIIQEKENSKKKPKRNAKSIEPLEQEKHVTENNLLPESIDENGIAVNGKSKNKAKRKSSLEIENSSSEPAEKRAKQEATEQSLNESTGNVKFDFKMKIMEILQTVDSINPKKLQKRIKKMYLKETGAAEFSEKILKKYNKKLKQIDNIELTENNVQLIKIAT